jgi:hypothetical protein
MKEGERFYLVGRGDQQSLACLVGLQETIGINEVAVWAKRWKSPPFGWSAS